ncbi:teichoic acid biosynthesis protein [Persicimonas caeni]|uniref:Teichoic acid biosynthesis protein n=1 Tax=Persicimonas caeni TaxID=2292766 RepID=A0A4Y6PYP0_PERCE|nr:MJ1255/VC2487 family glycosyltransferase [Persicimonas caeni]QDG53454.1 teichoic acid biosynthesis protein [Persicimonas caeni]QED34675.1 teichoic acid biosynthesis protein [Persicimonas caeni]
MKILYGVVGDGMGHAIRSSVVVEKLRADGHEVHLVASGRAVDYLRERFGDISEIWGLSMVMQDNEVKKRLTARHNLKGALSGFPDNVRRFFEVEAKFSPDAVISDFETWSWAFGKMYSVPVICLDNIQIINRCEHDDDIIAGLEDDFQLAKSVVKARTPRAAHYLITTFFHPPLRKERTTLVPPILRPSIVEAEPSDGDHLLVYQTSETFQTLPAMLEQLDVPVYIYGLRRDITEDQVEGNLTYRPFSDTQFVEDLASCRGVIASAGFTLVGEAVHLGKPYLATPVRSQFEQLMNARYLDKLGYGTYYEELDAAAIEHFLGKLPDYRAALANYERQDNQQTFDRLDELLDQCAAGLL